MRNTSCLPLLSLLQPLLLALALWAPTAYPADQTYSYDGNQWYEFEVVVFARDYRPGPRGEGTAPDLIDADYLPRTRVLSDPAASLHVTFPSESGSALEPLRLDEDRIRGLAHPIPTVARMGPDFSPPVRDAVRITDFARDPFVDISDRAAALGPVLDTLDRAGGYRVLWHRVWRQPLQDGASAPALFVAGGDSYGAHHELEGSLRVRGNDARMTLDLVLWLSRFAPDGGVDRLWHLPASPILQAREARQQEGPQEAQPENPAAPGRFPTQPATQLQWVPQEIWQLQQSQELGASQLHYVDHPVLGVLVQARPYQLPLGTEGASDF